MSELSRSGSIWRKLPLISFIVSEWQYWYAERTRPCDSLAPMPKDASGLPPYPIDMQSRLLSLPDGFLDEAGVPYNCATSRYPAGYHPTTIAQFALAQWNAYLSTGDEKHRKSFMIQANWLVAHESRMHDDTGGWPFTFSVPTWYCVKVPWLCALTQGNGIAVLIRAYRLTGKEVFLQVARRAVRTFELDIRDGGVKTSIGDDGVFFEECASYPASHILNGYISSLFGLYDYIAITGDAYIAALIQRSLATLHTLIDQFDTGYWSRYDLLHKFLAPRFYHNKHSLLLEALARYSNCEHCVALAARWRGYQHSLRCRLCYFLVRRFTRYRRGLQHFGIRGAFFHILSRDRRLYSD